MEQIISKAASSALAPGLQPRTDSQPRPNIQPTLADAGLESQYITAKETLMSIDQEDYPANSQHSHEFQNWSHEQQMLFMTGKEAESKALRKLSFRNRKCLTRNATVEVPPFDRYAPKKQKPTSCKQNLKQTVSLSFGQKLQPHPLQRLPLSKDRIAIEFMQSKSQINCIGSSKRFHSQKLDSQKFQCQTPSKLATIDVNPESPLSCLQQCKANYQKIRRRVLKSSVCKQNSQKPQDSQKQPNKLLRSNYLHQLLGLTKQHKWFEQKAPANPSVSFLLA